MSRDLEPKKIVCVGLNYRDHAEEQNVPLPTRPLLFAKFPSTIIGPGDPIVIPPITTAVDYEAELGVVIGERCRNVPAARALDVVSGYAAVNDVSARDLQFEDGQWTRGKSLDTFCPVGRVTPASEVSDPQNLRLRCILNDVPVQDSTTANMVFSVVEIIEFITQAITLEPGDLIATGTPAGVGFVRNPPIFLSPGDTVRIEVQSLAALENPVVAPG
jgi:2-keto-4-pentenoate hydratase/2-oxohepta-3-ene-1,7-dioic acid hydratase in catechol pathway